MLLAYVFSICYTSYSAQDSLTTRIFQPKMSIMPKLSDSGLDRG